MKYFGVHNWTLFLDHSHLICVMWIWNSNNDLSPELDGETRTNHACPLLNVAGLEWALHAAVAPDEHMSVVCLVQRGHAGLLHRDLKDLAVF